MSPVEVGPDGTLKATDESVVSLTPSTTSTTPDTPTTPVAETNSSNELSGEPDTGATFTPEAPLFTSDELKSEKDTKAEEKKVKCDELLKKMNAKLEEAGGETNIGVTDEYWEHLRDYRKLTAK